MKQILTVYTGGTIGCAPQDGQRKLNAAIAKHAIAANFKSSDSVYAPHSDTLFVDSGFSPQTLSENMTLSKWNALLAHLHSFDLSAFAGVIILHGTDTLGYTASMLSFALCDTPVPVLLVSGNRPPTDPDSNANINFRVAVELIMAGLAPNVYVPYRNSDGELWMHLGSTLLQCPTCSEDFRNACDRHAIRVDLHDPQAAVTACEAFRAAGEHGRFTHLTEQVLLLYPYTGLSYRAIALEAVHAIVHGTYHSGTVCVERNTEDEQFSPHSVLWLAERCRQAETPLFLAPCVLDESQYSSVFDAARHGAVPLSMTTEAAYGKALLGVSCGLRGKDLVTFMQTELNHEYL